MPVTLERMLPPNRADMNLKDAMLFHRGLKLNKKGPYASFETKVQPPNSSEFLEFGRVAVSAMAPAATYTLISYQIPEGHRGVLKNRGFWFNGAGFVEGSGVLTFSVAIGDGWLYNTGNVLYSIGPDNDTALTGDGGGVILRPNVCLSIYVTTGADISSLDPQGVVIGQLRGWYVPLRGLNA